jgi:hypothetical protein
MSKQWGHGFYRGVESAQAKQGTLVGLWFHSRHDGSFGWQGQVKRDLGNGQYTVQLFSWLDGEPTIQKVVAFDTMKGWDFYDADADMRAVADRELDKWGEDISRIPNNGLTFRRVFEP